MSISEIKLARSRVPVFCADRTMAGHYAIDAVRALYHCGRVAATRKLKDGRITHVYLLASPGEIAPRSHRTPTVTQVLPMTWQHNLKACYAFRPAALV